MYNMYMYMHMSTLFIQTHCLWLEHLMPRGDRKRIPSRTVCAPPPEWETRCRGEVSEA